MSRRWPPGRGTTVLAALACAGALLALGAGTWVGASVSDPLTGTSTPLVVPGGEAAPLVAALALVGAAAAIAISTARRVLLLVAAAVLTLAGLGALGASAVTLLDPAAAVASAAQEASGTTSAAPGDVRVGWAPVVAVLPAAGLIVTGAWALLAGRRWVSTSRFERDVAAAPVSGEPSGPAEGDDAAPTARGGRPAQTPTATPPSPDGAGPPGATASPRLWDELSGGEDPTR